MTRKTIPKSGPLVFRRMMLVSTATMATVVVAILNMIMPHGAVASDNGLGITPQMGWNPWNLFGCDIHEDLIKDIADALVDTGLRDLGYDYLNLDDCWQLSRNASGYIVEDPKKFPSGMAHLSDYVHSKGLFFGLYSDSGLRTCQGRPGGYGHESLDAETYVSWKVDYLKYDNCFAVGLGNVRKRYQRMHDALQKATSKNQSRPIFFSLCEWGIDDPATWAPSIGNSWRTTGDIEKSYRSITEIADANDRWHEYAGPGGWNDPDMLEIGTIDSSTGHKNDQPVLTIAEQRSHFTIWCLMKAPLLLAMDLRTEQDYSIWEIITNTEVIAINQDPLGIQGYKRKRWEYNDDGMESVIEDGVTVENAVEVWAGPLAGNNVAVVLWNRSPKARTINVDFKDVWDPVSDVPSSALRSTAITANLRDLWEHAEKGVHVDSFSAIVPPHDVVALRMSNISVSDHIQSPSWESIE